jgi:hypothetical protein
MTAPMDLTDDETVRQMAEKLSDARAALREARSIIVRYKNEHDKYRTFGHMVDLLRKIDAAVGAEECTCDKEARYTCIRCLNVPATVPPHATACTRQRLCSPLMAQSWAHAAPCPLAAKRGAK